MAKLTAKQCEITKEKNYYTGKELLAIARVASDDPSRENIFNILVTARGDLVATDGHKLAIVAQATPSDFTPFLIESGKLKDLRATDLCYFEQDKLIAASARGNVLEIKASGMAATFYPEVSQVIGRPDGGAPSIGLGVGVLEETLALFKAFGIIGIKWSMGKDELCPIHATASGWSGDREVGIQVVAMPMRLDAKSGAMDLTDFLAREATAKKATSAA